MSDTGITVSGVHFSYPSHSVLEDVSFEVKRGQFAAILGPNGSGKTTLLKAISGYIPVSRGGVSVLEWDVAKLALAEIARKMAVVTQSPAFDFPFTVGEYVALGRSPHLRRFARPSVKDVQVVAAAMESAGVQQLANRPVDELSGGEQRRVAIARALAQDAQVMLLDEPTSSLDINHQVSIMALLLTLARRNGTTVVAVLHDLNVAAAYCDAVVLMNDGRVFATGAPVDVITRQNVREVYGQGFDVTISPSTGRPFVLPSAARSEANRRFDVFVIGGGGSASPLLNYLVRERVGVSLGVINAGDADWFTCQARGIPVVEEQPFSPIGEEALFRATGAALMADAVVVAPTPFGPGNVANLSVAEKVLSSGKTVVVIARESIVDRDYTGGEAKKRIAGLIASGAIPAKDEDEALIILRRCGKWEEKY